MKKSASNVSYHPRSCQENVKCRAPHWPAPPRRFGPQGPIKPAAETLWWRIGRLLRLWGTR